MSFADLQESQSAPTQLHEPQGSLTATSQQQTPSAQLLEIGDQTAQPHSPVLGGADDDEVVFQNGPAVKMAGGDAELVVLHGNVLGRIAQLLEEVRLQQGRVGSQVKTDEITAICRAKLGDACR